MDPCVTITNPACYHPDTLGKRPAYGWYIHNASNISFTGGSSVDFQSGDARPAVIADGGGTITFDGFKAERSTGSNDVLFRSINPYCVRNSTNTAGGALRVSATGSTQSCPSGAATSRSVRHRRARPSAPAVRPPSTCPPPW